MSKAVTLIRQSQGEEDSISLEIQREKTSELASSLADDVKTVDLGGHTGFSVHMKGELEERIDNHPDMIRLLEDLRAGDYEYLVAYDDTRIARDQFYWEVKRAAIEGDCEILFVEDVPEDELTFRVQRAVESQVKMNEIQKSIEANERRVQEGAYQGRPPRGLEYDDDGFGLVPGDRYDEALAVIRARLVDELSWRLTVEETGVPRGTAQRIVKRSEEYLDAGDLELEELVDVASRTSD